MSLWACQVCFAVLQGLLLQEEGGSPKEGTGERGVHSSPLGSGKGHVGLDRLKLQCAVISFDFTLVQNNLIKLMHGRICSAH